MDRFLKSPFTKIICIYLVLFLAGFIPVPDQAWASFITHQQEVFSEMDLESLEKLRVVLEDELILEKLNELGLTSEEIIQRIERLGPEERQAFLDGLSTLQAGGDDLIFFIYWLWFVEYVLPILLGIAFIALIVRLADKKGSRSSASSSLKEPVLRSSEMVLPTYEEGAVFKSAGIDLAPFNGVVLILPSSSKPPDYSIKVGDIYISQKMSRDRLLSEMQTVAARHGADMLVLYNDEPLNIGDGWYTWSAQVYTTRIMDQTE